MGRRGCAIAVERMSERGGSVFDASVFHGATSAVGCGGSLANVADVTPPDNRTFSPVDLGDVFRTGFRKWRIALQLRAGGVDDADVFR